jgi:hypothetical protein
MVGILVENPVMVTKVIFRAGAISVLIAVNSHNT